MVKNPPKITRKDGTLIFRDPKTGALIDTCDEAEYNKMDELMREYALRRQEEAIAAQKLLKSKEGY